MVRGPYADFGPTLAHEKLTEVHGDPKAGDGYTWFGRAMFELNIDIICAISAPAKGRVERAHQTLQDRLVKELRLRQVSTMEGANLRALFHGGLQPALRARAAQHATALTDRCAGARRTSCAKQEGSLRDGQVLPPPATAV